MQTQSENLKTVSPRLRLVGPRMPVNLPLILERIDAGYYDRPEVIEETAAAVLIEIRGSIDPRNPTTLRSP